MIVEASRLVLNGGTVVYPTETVYGIGASAFDEEAVKKVYRIKHRPRSMQLFVAISSFSMLERVARVEKSDLAFLRKLLPGPIAVLLDKTQELPGVVTAGSSLVGIRFPYHKMALELIERTGPIISSSANLSGSPPPASVAELDLTIAKSVDMVLDGGRCEFAQPSTLIDLKGRKILREGAGMEILRGLMK